VVGDQKQRNVGSAGPDLGLKEADEKAAQEAVFSEQTQHPEC
jgi:hypothetical protein